MKPVYCISGLGADERIFSKLEIQGSVLMHLKWLSPEINESLITYAGRIARQLQHDRPVLIGVSFGGMVAIEIAKLIPVEKIILISSIKSHRELPAWMKVCGRYKFDAVLPGRPLKSIKALQLLRPVQNYFLGTRSEEEKKIANEFRDNVDPVYLKWSLKQVLNWKNDWQPPRIFHLHGSKDHIFPISKLKPTHIIQDGGHFMVMQCHREISRILEDII
jgi:pimeloyl-ACP methyl ester carboxylesterase